MESDNNSVSSDDDVDKSDDPVVKVERGGSESPKESLDVDERSKDGSGTKEEGGLSDVSDADSRDGSEISKERATVAKKASDENKIGGKDEELLDFEAEDREEGECEGGQDDESEGEVADGTEGLEEGELTEDEGEGRGKQEMRPICRFYNKGQCTWGANCRFLHPGVTDKGNYSMFEPMRTILPFNGPVLYPERPFEQGETARKESSPGTESAWERGLRQAKEIMRKATKRKETDIDFEEKKMNLSLGQDDLDKENDYYTRPASPLYQDEERFDDAYGEEVVAPAPAATGEYWRRVSYDGDSRHLRVEADYSRERVPQRDRGLYVSIHNVAYQEPRQTRTRKHYPEGGDTVEAAQSFSMPRSRREEGARRSAPDRATWKDERHQEVSGSRRAQRGDEWCDPWMRKSPFQRSRATTRRQSYSSGSSYTSSSSGRSTGRSSSSSSYSSRSRSRSRSKHSTGRTPRSKTRSPSPPKIGRRRPPAAPAPSARSGSDRRGAVPPSAGPPPPPPPSIAPLHAKKEPQPVESVRISRQPVPAVSSSKPPSLPVRPTPVPPRKPSPVRHRSVSRSRSKSKSRSSSASSSASGTKSKSRSRSSSSTYSSSSGSSRRLTPPPARYSRVDERRVMAALAGTAKIKPMDAMKLSGQKQQIKLTLKAPGSNPAPPKRQPEPVVDIRRVERVPVVSRKRSLDSPPSDIEPQPKVAAVTTKAPAPRKAALRREELLKQLKAVEDAIARKRSKLQ